MRRHHKREEDGKPEHVQTRDEAAEVARVTAVFAGAGEVAQADEPTEEDLAAANALLAERTPEELAAALVRMYRARLPAPLTRKVLRTSARPR